MYTFLIGLTLFYYPHGIADVTKERYVVTIKNVVIHADRILFEIQGVNKKLYVPSYTLTTGSKEEMLLCRLEN